MSSSLEVAEYYNLRRQLESARAWAVQLEQEVAHLQDEVMAHQSSDGYERGHHHGSLVAARYKQEAKELRAKLADSEQIVRALTREQDERIGALSSLLRGMARRSVQWRQKSDWYQEAAEYQESAAAAMRRSHSLTIRKRQEAQEQHRAEVAELQATISGLRAALSAVREVRARQIGDGAQVGP